MKALLIGGTLAAAFGAGWYVQGLRWDADIAERGKVQADDISAGQKSIIAGQAFQFQRYNEIARQANQDAITIKGQSDEKQIIYRTIIKRDPAGRQCVPDDVAKRLLDYAHSLRASAMRTVASGADAAGTGTAAAGCRLTYGQAVYWIEPLLTTIDLANSQLVSISDVESARKGK
ncbi:MULTISPECIES: hypothetical protein [unclassified Brenneria]|uniref:hypothetical protein n=1 Tax=unclassified Brenneria TaxID=2634434 RepID=UPI0020A697B6|nr:hypothetical protein [Brenneria sp. hezel4-2-4]MEE3649469.1 hypothetical protein [Brenneria sp. HEZEL_4_2_4]